MWEGELSLINGGKYIGMFKDDKYNGKGKLIDNKGNIIQEGVFKDGVFVPPKKKKDKGENEDNKNNPENNNKEEDKDKENVQEKKE